MPAFDFLFYDAGVMTGSPVSWQASVWPPPTQPDLADDEVGGSVSVATWRNGRRAFTQSGTARLQDGTAPEFGDPSAPTAMTWLFALQIPDSSGAFAGVGPCSTVNTPGKNFPLYFKSSTVIGSQPSSSNRDSALDMSPYYGLDAVITVRQAAAGIRFSMWIDGVGEVVTTASGEATATNQAGLAICGWTGSGGEFPFPIGMVACFYSALSDGDQDAARDWAAEYFAIPGAP